MKLRCSFCARTVRVRREDRRVVWHRRRGRKWCEGSVAVLAKPPVVQIGGVWLP